MEQIGEKYRLLFYALRGTQMVIDPFHDLLATRGVGSNDELGRLPRQPHDGGRKASSQPRSDSVQLTTGVFERIG